MIVECLKAEYCGMFMSAKSSVDFYTKIKDAKKLMVLDLGFLGDTIHLIPSLNAIRKNLPNIELHVMIAEHVTDVLEMTPWVDKVWGYPRFPKGPKWYQDFGRIKKLRSENFDAIINLNGSDRSSILTLMSGARFRLGRVPEKVHALWDKCFTDIVNVPYGQDIVFKQRYECLMQSGFRDLDLDFNLIIGEKALQWADKKLGKMEYIHVSPFTSVNTKELPLKQLAGLLHELSDAHPKQKIVLTTAPNKRERGKLKQLIHHLHFENWLVIEEELDLSHLSAVIQKANLHLGADTGTVHLALALGQKTVSWYRENPLNQIHWMPKGEKHKSVTGEPSELGLIGISNADILDKVNILLT